MKKILLFSLIFFFNINIYSQKNKENSTTKRPKIGLALSGGGAKGFAHIGVLKILDSLNVKIDYISGTSMGAIVGGLYASGYSGKDIEKIVTETDFYSLLNNQKQRKEASFFDKSVEKYLISFPIQKKKITLPSSLSTGQRNIYILKELFKNVANINDFSKLPIPFMCVATDLETGESRIFEEGDIVQSIMASSAFPSLIDPVKINDKVYVDGAMSINFPSKPLKDKGIDIVIGVNLSTGLHNKEQITNIVDILNQIVDFGIQKETKKQLSHTDIHIHPNLQGMTVTSFDQKKIISEKGYQEALKYVPILDKLPKKQEEDIVNMPINPIYSNLYKIDSISVNNNFIYNKDYIQGKMGLKIPSVQTYSNINNMIDRLYATNNFSLINYDIVQENFKNVLKLSTMEIDNQYMLKFGLHYDKLFKTGLLINLTMKRLILKNSTLSIDGVIGDSPRYYINYFIDNGFLPSFGGYASGMKLELKNEQEYTFEQWKWFRNELFIQSTWWDKFAVGIGIRHDYFDAFNFINNTSQSENFINPYAFLRADTQDDRDFPTSGFVINLEGKFIGLLDKNTNKSLQIKGKADFSFPINSWASYRLESFAGVSMEKTPSFYHFHLGGIFEQNLGNFFKFYGYQFGQNNNNNVIGVINSLSFNLYKNYYIIPHFSIANLFDSIKEADFLKINYSSVGLSVGYKSPFGQIKINYSQPLKNRAKGVFNIVLGHWF